ncbi:MAG TPA: hypothetical protein VKB52_10795 [Rhodanobacteraceae bacterium]|nr:hypothetical protein [Rhodanobacteraceae bacterium]
MLDRVRVAEVRGRDVEPAERRDAITAIRVDLAQRIGVAGRADQCGQRDVGLGDAIQPVVGEGEAFLAQRRATC